MLTTKNSLFDTLATVQPISSFNAVLIPSRISGRLSTQSVGKGRDLIDALSCRWKCSINAFDAN